MSGILMVGELAVEARKFDGTKTSLTVRRPATLAELIFQLAQRTGSVVGTVQCGKLLDEVTWRHLVDTSSANPLRLRWTGPSALREGLPATHQLCAGIVFCKEGEDAMRCLRMSSFEGQFSTKALVRRPKSRL